MQITIAFIVGDSIYHSDLEYGEKITFGGGKKDTIQVPEVQDGQISIVWNKKGILMSSKSPFSLNKVLLQEEESYVISEEYQMSVFVSAYVGENGRAKLPYNGTVKIGRSKTKNDIFLPNGYVSGEHLRLQCEAGIVHAKNVSHTNGTYLNGKWMTSAKLKSGDVLSILTMKIRFLNGELIFENFGQQIINHLDKIIEEYPPEPTIEPPQFQRSTRIQEQLPTEPITLAAPPNRSGKFEKRRGMFSSLVGTGAMVATSVAMGTASPAFLAARAASLIMPGMNVANSVSGNKRQQKKLEEYERMRRELYGQYIDEQKARILQVADEQRNILTKENLAPEDWVQVVQKVSRNLWERSAADRDFLDVRLGMSYEKLCVEVKNFSSDSSFQMENDDVRMMAEQMIEETRIVDYIPARLQLRKYSTVGMLGNRPAMIRLMRNMLISLVSSHFYKDVKIVGIFDSEETEEWASLRWLPHVWDENKQTRYLAFNKQDAHQLCEMMNGVLEERKRLAKERENESNIWKSAAITPHYIFIIGSRSYVEDETIMQNLVHADPAMGVSTIFLFGDMHLLPLGCQYIVDTGHAQEGNAYERDKANQRRIFTFDTEISKSKFDLFARHMSAIEVKGFAEKAEIPGAVTFLQGYGVQSVKQLDALNRWKQNKVYKSMAAPVGMLSGKKLFSLDVMDDEKAHGPHGLVAGTPGSGKSEMLITWILSMALNYHPHDVAFVLIDYKGGGMAAPLVDLPHVIGTITNIEGNIDRQLMSLKSELVRRQNLFSKYSIELGITINKISIYQKLYWEGRIPEPLPRLIIVADEFAELKSEKPDFMNELVSASRIGRSLGVHLVLATQKPSGVVTDEIQANSRFRICLKVQMAADSREMIRRADAAAIKTTGRAYIQVGFDEVFELFQSFWSGAQYSPDGRSAADASNQVRLVAANGTRIKTVQDERTRFRSEVTELSAIVQYLKNTAEEQGIQKLNSLWMEELPKVLPLRRLLEKMRQENAESKGFSLRLPAGLYDAPETQSQGIQYFDLTETPNVGIFGAAFTGKTTLLKTAIFAAGLLYTPEEVQIYVIDCGGMNLNILKKMPHIGGIVFESEREKMQKLQKMILDEIEYRKKLFMENYVSSLKGYRESGKKDLAAWIIVVDNLVHMFELYPDLEDLFVTLTSAGASYGIYLIFSANSKIGIKYKVQQNISWSVAFQMADASDYSNILGPLQGKILPDGTGRAFAQGKMKQPPIVFQAAISMDGENDREKSRLLQQKVDAMDREWSGKRPRPIPVMPEKLTAQENRAMYQERNILPLGIKYENISPAITNMSEQYSTLITGTIGCGKSRYLMELAQMIHEKRPTDKLYVFDSKEQSLMMLKASVNMYGVCNDDAKMTEMIQEIRDILNVRLRAQRAAKNEDPEGFSDQKFSEQYEQICIFIDDLKSFVAAISNENRDTMDRFARGAGGLGVLIFAAGRIADVASDNVAEPLTRALVSNQKGLLLAGSAAMCSFFQNNLSFAEKNVELGEKEAYLFDNGKCEKIMPIDFS